MKKNFINDSSEGYPKRIKISVLTTIMLFIILFAFAPSMKSSPYALKSESSPVVLQTVIEPLKNITDVKEIKRQSLPKKIVETNNQNEVTDIDIETNFEDSVLINSEDDRIYTVYETPPTLVSPINVDYPEMARKMGIEGKVFLEVVIEKNGIVSSVKVLKSDNVILNEAAIDAVKKAQFSPAMSRDIPVRCIVTLPIMFRLK
ncbi:MAG: energy transducer TonB [bacterium]|nr:energy transducer TonB [bacterium]